MVLFGDRLLYFLLAALDPETRRALQGARRFRERPRAHAGERGSCWRVWWRRSRARRVCSRSTGRPSALVLEHAARLAEHAGKLTLAGRAAARGAERGRFLGTRGRARRDRAGRTSSARWRSGSCRVSRLRDRAQESILAEGRADRHERRPGRPDQRPQRDRARRLLVRAPDPHHLPGAAGHRQGGRHRARGRARRPDPLQGRADPVGISRRPLCARRADVAVREPGVRAVLFAASKATAPPRPSSTRCCRRWRRLPLRQDLAVTGSVNQHGEVQAIGGVNEKIEGFFDICRARGLTGTQGVLIPQANVQHLMLREDVVEACARRAVRRLSGRQHRRGHRAADRRAAGERGADGLYPDGSINRRVEDRLRAFAEVRRSFERRSTSAEPTS